MIGKSTAKVNWLFVNTVVQIGKPYSRVYIPDVRELALELRFTITLVDPPTASVPPPGEASSQDEVLARDQVSEFVPLLVKEKVSFVTVKGQPSRGIKARCRCDLQGVLKGWNADRERVIVLICRIGPRNLRQSAVELDRAVTLSS